MTTTIKSLSNEDVIAFHKAEIDLGKSAKDARQGTRTRVQEELQKLNPVPYSDTPSHVEAKILTGKVGLDKSEREAILDHQFAQVTVDEMVASERARRSVDGTHRDAHHYVQKQHQKGLWEEADKLVNIALGGAS
jgi:hypothetical protein